MNSKRNFLVLLVVFLAAVVLSAGCTGTDSSAPEGTVVVEEEIMEITYPDLTGTWVWTGDLVGHSLKRGFDSTATSWTMNITGQDGRTFAGYKDMAYGNGTETRENFSGAISYDGKTLYMSDHKEGLNIGEVISSDEIELIYLDDGDNARTMIIYLIRE